MDNNNFKGKKYQIYPLPEALFIGFGVFFAIFLTTYFIYFHALNAQIGEIKEGLLRTAKIVTTFIDGDKHTIFKNRSQETSKDYLDAIRPFQAVLDADETIKYLYTGILKDGKVYFILDPTPTGDADGDGVDDKAHIMDEYPEASKEMISALEGEQIVISKEPYTDRWGSFISGYIPFYDSNGSFIGVLGIDIQASNFFERLAPIKRATVRTMVSGFFIAFLIASLVWFTRNFGLRINHKRLNIIDELQHVQTSTTSDKHKNTIDDNPNK